MSADSRRMAGILLVVFPTVLYGGLTLLFLLVDPNSGYMENPLRQNLWRAGHAHAGVLLLLSLVSLHYVDHAALSSRLKAFTRNAIPLSALILPAAFFLSVLSPEARRPGPLIYLAYPGAFFLASGLLLLGVGLLRKKREDRLAQ